MFSQVLDYTIVGNKSYAMLPTTFDPSTQFCSVIWNGIILLPNDYTLLPNHQLEINTVIDGFLEFQWDSKTSTHTVDTIDYSNFPLRIDNQLKNTIESVIQCPIIELVEHPTNFKSKNLYINNQSIQLLDYMTMVCSLTNPLHFRISESFETITLVYNDHSIIMRKFNEQRTVSHTTLVYKGVYQQLPCEFSITFQENLGECEFLEMLTIINISPLLFSL